MAVTKKYYLDSEGLKHLIQRIVAEDKRRDIIAANGIELTEQGNPTGSAGKSIGIKIKSGDQILTKDSNGLAAAVKLVEYTETEISKSTWNDKENVLKAYKLVGADGTTVLTGSEPIKIYKDRSLASVHVGNPANQENKESLYFVYNLANGTTQTVEVDMSQFALDYTAGDGIVIDSNGVVSVNAGIGLIFGIATGGGTKPLEIEVSSGRLGMGDAIDSNLLRYSTGTGDWSNYGTGLIVPESQVRNIAQKLIDNLDWADGSFNQNQYVYKVVQEDGKITSVLRQNVDLATLVDYTPKQNPTRDDVATTDTIADAIKKLENQISAVQLDAGAAHSVVALTGATSGATTTSAHLTLTVSTDSQTGAKTYTFAETNIADADDLTAEISNRKAVTGINGDTYAVPTPATGSINYLTGATSLADADVKLDQALKNVADTAATYEVVTGDVITATKSGTPNKTNLSVGVDGNTIMKSGGVLTSGLKIVKQGTAETGYAATYFLADKDGVAVSGSKINITQDQFLKSVEYFNDKASAVKAHAADTNGSNTGAADGITFPAMRFEWDLATDTDGESPDKGKGVSYVSISAMGAAATTTLTVQTTNGQTVADGSDFILITTTTNANGSTNYVVTTRGIKDYIKAQIEALDATVTSGVAKNATGAISGNNATHVGVEIVEADGKLTGVTIVEKDVASASDLTDEVTRAKAAETAIDSAVGLTKAANSETRTWTPTTNYGGSSDNAQRNMQSIDNQVKANADAIADLQAAIESIHNDYIDDLWEYYISHSPISHNPDGTTVGA